MGASPAIKRRQAKGMVGLSPSPDPRVRSTLGSDGNPSGVIVPRSRIATLYGDSAVTAFLT